MVTKINNCNRCSSLSNAIDKNETVHIEVYEQLQIA